MERVETTDDRPVILLDCEQEEDIAVSFTQAEQKGLLGFLFAVLQTERFPNLRSDDLWMKAVEQGVTNKPPGVVHKFVIDDLLLNLKNLPGSVISDKEKTQLDQLIKKNDEQRDIKERKNFFGQFSANVKQYGEKRQARENKRLLRLQACPPVSSPVSSASVPQATTSKDKSANGGEMIDDDVVVIDDGGEAIDEDLEDKERLERHIKREKRIDATNFSASPSPPRQYRHKPYNGHKGRRNKHTNDHKRALFLFLAGEVNKRRDKTKPMEWKGNKVWKEAEKKLITELSWQGMRGLALKIVPNLNAFSNNVLPLQTKKILLKGLKGQLPLAPVMDGVECTSSLNSSAIDSASLTPLRAEDNVPPADAAPEAVSPDEPKEPMEKPVDAFASVPFGTPEFDAAVYQGVFTENLMPAELLPQFFRSLETLIRLATEHNIGLEQLMRWAEQHGNVDTDYLMATPLKKKKRTDSQTPPAATSTPITLSDNSMDYVNAEEFLTPKNSQEQQLVSSTSLALKEAAPVNASALSSGDDSLAADASNSQATSSAAQNALFRGIMSLSSTGAETKLPAFDAAVYDAVFEHKLLPVDQVQSFYASLTALVELAKTTKMDFRVLVAEATKRGSVSAVAAALKDAAST
uniref:Uncharacterized protein n=1 Tax=Plectus sambesii TaxID=2011161 RepID=A0A914WFY4_9BILA